ncbi:hypothetical protein GGI11_004012 [Coemansia sp. RSA 2049]|nr:hypothetical protein GGI11_004012 [Coemansia sp. RSA 2049]KAJ2607510.1 hypothetical protein EV177_005473 [Coemansia sp. RSA 1804]
MGLCEASGETQTAVRRWAMRHMRTYNTRLRESEDTWHLSVAMRAVWGDPAVLNRDNGAMKQLLVDRKACKSSSGDSACDNDCCCCCWCAAGRQLAGALVQSRWYVEHAYYSGTGCMMYVRLNHLALMGAFAECVSAVSLGSHLYGAEPFPARVFKWVNIHNAATKETAAAGGVVSLDTRISEYRSALVANVLAHVAAELSQISGYGMGPQHLEILRGRGARHLLFPHEEEPLVGEQRRDQQLGRIFGRSYASLHMPKMLAALDRAGALYRSHPGTANLSLYVRIPTKHSRTTTSATVTSPPLIADSCGRVSDLACDACVVFMQMVEEAVWSSRQNAASRTLLLSADGHPQVHDDDRNLSLFASADDLENGIVWYHVVPDSRCRLHWDRVIQVAELAYYATNLKGSAILRIENIVCSVGQASVDKNVLAIQNEQEQEQEVGERTRLLLRHLGIIQKSDNAKTSGDGDLGTDKQLSKTELRALQINMHCGMLRLASRKGQPYTLGLLETRRQEGAFLLDAYARLRWAVAAQSHHPEPGTTWRNSIHRIRTMDIKGLHAQTVAHLAAQLPDMLRRTLQTHRPEVLVEYFVRLSHVASKCLCHFGSISATLSVAETESRVCFLNAIRFLLGLGIRTMGCNPDDDDDDDDDDKDHRMDAT